MPLPSGYLLDTNILLALMRQNNLGKYLDAHYGLTTGANPFILCVVTVGEMFALANKLNWGTSKKVALSTLLNQFVWVDISDLGLLQTYGQIDAAAQSLGLKMGKNDLWIAATSKVTNTTTLTTDKDFDTLYPAWIDREWVDPAST